MTIECAAREGDNTDYIEIVRTKLNDLFHEIKRNNPKGFKDEFESRFENLCMQVAQELDAQVFQRDGSMVFNFSGVTLKV